MKLICPICKEELIRYDKSYKCLNKHLFDLAKEGYLNLNRRYKNTGDAKEMIIARHNFLKENHFVNLKNEINNIIDYYKPTNILDLACGEGYYTSSYNSKNKIGIDLSKTALKIASKEDKNTLYILNTIYDVPLNDQSVDLITIIFAPLPKKEIKRLLNHNGIFINVRANKKHLIELKELMYDMVKENIIDDIKIDGLIKIDEYNIVNKTLLKYDDIQNLLKMTPYYYKTSSKDKAKLNNINDLLITFDFMISIYKKC